MAEHGGDTTLGGSRVRFPRVPGVVIILFILALVFALLDPRFLELRNLTNVATQSAVLLMLAGPMTVIILTEGIDISLGAVLSLCGVAFAAVLAGGGGLLPAVAAAIGIGLATGFVNGVAVAYLSMPPFLVTLSTMSVAQGISLAATNGSVVRGLPDWFAPWFGTMFLGAGAAIPASLVFFLVIAMLHRRTKFGRYVVVLGGNAEALVLAGVPARRYLVAVYLLGGVGAALGSVLMTARLGLAHPTVGIGLEFDAVAAVILGGTRLEKGNGWLPGTILGVAVIGVARNGLNLLAISSAVQVICVGLLVIAALTLDGVKRQGN